MLSEQQIHIHESIARREIKRVLCPTDLSTESDQALRYDVALARTYQAKLFACYCVEKDDPKWHGYINGLYHIKQLFEESLGQYVSVADKPPLEWESLIAQGKASAAITEMAESSEIDLIVMNSRRRPYAAALLGSTAEAVCHNARCPVLVTHAGE